LILTYALGVMGWRCFAWWSRAVSGADCRLDHDRERTIKSEDTVHCRLHRRIVLFQFFPGDLSQRGQLVTQSTRIQSRALLAGPVSRSGGSQSSQQFIVGGARRAQESRNEKTLTLSASAGPCANVSAAAEPLTPLPENTPCEDFYVIGRDWAVRITHRNV
jgi:hypothetical protein